MAASPRQTKTLCKYGSKCYRRNLQHLSEYKHPCDDKKSEDLIEDSNAAMATTKPPKMKGRRKTATKRTINDFFKPAGTESKESSESDSGETPVVKQKKSCSDACLVEDTESASLSTEAGEEEEPPVYADDVKQCLKQLFLVDMPQDFYQFWEFCQACRKSDPLSALHETLGLHLSGPFDVLSGKHKNVSQNKQRRRPNFLLHQRYFYDPPEFQTVLVSEEKNFFHIGYFRDDPNEMPVFLASNTPGPSSNNPEKITQCGENIFAAVHIYANQKVKLEKGEKKKGIEKLIQAIEKEAKKLDLPLAATTKGMKARQKKVNCPTFHGAGMVVPVDANDVGYRPVPETQKDLKVMLKKMLDADSETKREEASEALQEIITFIQFANDECDYGQGLELALCLFSYGRKELHPQISLLMPLAYQLLHRTAFQKIIEEHLNSRRCVGQCVDEL